MVKLAGDKIKWHPAFEAAIQLEFKEYKNHLEFLVEHQLTDEPLRIDVVIIKKLKDIKIDKKIGKILEKYNIFEYKSPKDYISIDDYYKVRAYAYLYKVLSGETNSISLDEITITLVSNRRPNKLIEYIKNNTKINISKIDSGLYYIEDTDIKTQLIITKELSDEESTYLKVLQLKHNNRNSLKKVLTEYLINKKDPLYSIIMNVLAEANPEEIMGVYKDMGKPQLSKENMDLLIEIMKNMKIDEDFMNEGRIEGKTESIIEILSDIGDVPQKLKKFIYSQKDINVLNKWIKIAAKSEGIKEFEDKINFK